jgi:hypothetical protein
LSNYTQSTNFATKDALPSGDPLKIVKGTEINTEFNNIATAIATKADLISPTLVTPALGTPASGVLTNTTGLPIVAGTTGTLSVARGGTGVTTSTGTGSVVLSASPTFTGTPALPTGTTAVTQSAGNSTTAVATTAFVGAAITAFDTALTVSTAQIEDVAVTNAKLASGAAVANIGFNPVQQGGGANQGTNKVFLGWTSSNELSVQVDATDLGPVVLKGQFTGGNQSLSGNGYQKLPGGLIMQWGTFSQTGAITTVSFPISFPNACWNVQQTLANGASVSGPAVGSVTASGFVSIRDPAVGNNDCYFFAIGY